jgi:hypothetical protein
VWVGFDTPQKTVQGGFGSVLSLPVWVDIMKTADRLGYKAGALHSKVNLVTEELCRLSGKRATQGCREAATAYTDQVPADIALAETDLCPIHPARAQAVDLSAPREPTAPMKALPVEETPLKAEPVEDEVDTPLKAVPVDDGMQ